MLSALISEHLDVRSEGCSKEVEAVGWLEAHISQLVDRAHAVTGELQGHGWGQASDLGDVEVGLRHPEQSDRVLIVKTGIPVISLIYPLDCSDNALRVNNLRSTARQLISVALEGFAYLLSEEVVNVGPGLILHCDIEFSLSPKLFELVFCSLRLPRGSTEVAELAGVVALTIVGAVFVVTTATATASSTGEHLGALEAADGSDEHHCSCVHHFFDVLLCWICSLIGYQIQINARLYSLTNFVNRTDRVQRQIWLLKCMNF